MTLTLLAVLLAVYAITELYDRRCKERFEEEDKKPKSNKFTIILVGALIVIFLLAMVFFFMVSKRLTPKNINPLAKPCTDKYNSWWYNQNPKPPYLGYKFVQECTNACKNRPTQQCINSYWGTRIQPVTSPEIITSCRNKFKGEEAITACIRKYSGTQ